MAWIPASYLEALKNLPLPVRNPGSAPIFMKSGLFRVLLEGRLDLFAQAMTPDGLAGPRQFLCSFETGDVLVDFQMPAADVKAIAVATGETRYLEGSWSDIQSPALAEVKGILLEACAHCLIPPLALRFGYTAALNTLMETGKTTCLQAGQRAGIREPFGFFRVRSGQILILGRKDLEVGPDDGLFPLSKTLWVEAGADGADLEPLKDQEYADATELAPGFLSVRNCLLTLALDHLQAEPLIEAERLERKALSEIRWRQKALDSLVSVLAPQGEEAALPHSDSALLEACLLVGVPLGIRFQAPASWVLEDYSLEPLDAICRCSRIRSRKVALRGPWWKADAGPLLGYLGPDRRPVALLSTADGNYLCHDPQADGPQILDEKLRKDLEPIAVQFYRPTAAGAIGTKDLLRDIWLDIKKDLYRVLWMALGSGLLGLVLPIAMNLMISEVIPQAELRSLWVLFGSLISVALGVALFDFSRALALLRLESKAGMNLQAMLVDRLLSLPVPFFRNYSVGDLAMRSMAVSQAWSILSGAAFTTVISAVFSVFNLGLMFWYDSKLAWIAIFILAAVILVNGSISWAMLRVERKHQAISGHQSGLVFQLVNGIGKLRTAFAENRGFAVYCEGFASEQRLALRSADWRLVARVFNEMLPIAATLILFAKVSSEVTSANFLSFNSAFGTFFASGVALSSTLISMLQIGPILERAKPILESVPEVDESKPDPGKLTGQVEVNHVSFRYTPDGPAILSDITFQVEPGQFIALVGPSGSGKSTTLRLLLGFEKPETGVVYYGHQDIASIDAASLRSQIGVVLQSSKLMAGTIFTNIVGSSLLTLDEAWAAAEAAGLAEDIRDLPMGMHTVLSEGATTISGGQRQRLLIARALVRKPRILLFDEATSALDNRSQEIVSQSLEKLNATRIVIAHRLSTIRNADCIHVVDHGRIVQSGTFQELSQQPGLFRHLIERQMA